MSEKMKKLALGIEIKQKELSLIAKNEYPIGTIVDVEIWGHKAVRLEVTGHAENWWSSAGEIYGVNVITEKNRTFNPANDKTVMVATARTNATSHAGNHSR